MYFKKKLTTTYISMEINQNYILKSRKAWRIKYVLKCFLKEFKESAFLKDAGILFHNLGPAIENLRSP